MQTNYSNFSLLDWIINYIKRASNYLLKQVGFQFEEDRKGIHLYHFLSWQVVGKIDAYDFFIALPDLIPKGSVLCVEGTSFAPPVVSFLKQHKTLNKTNVSLCISWPKPKVFHILTDISTLRSYANLSNHHASPELFDNIYIYNESTMLIEYCEAFFSNQDMFFSKIIEKNKLITFCKKFNLKLFDNEKTFFQITEDKGYSRKEVLDTIESLEQRMNSGWELAQELFDLLKLNWPDYFKAQQSHRIC